jgi:6-pyruvoyltetrahydropterin/6-carboxytetrahydropterin synthase
MAQRWTLHKTVEFDAAHRLKSYNGKCKNLHGHRWKVTFEVESQFLDDQEMVIDFSALKSEVMKFDHAVMLEAGDPLVNPLVQEGQHVVVMSHAPTAENIAELIYRNVHAKLRDGTWLTVEVEESPGSSVKYQVL